MRRVLLTIVVIAGLLVGTQLLLPTLAEHRVRGQLERYGEVEKVDIHAFPAIRLLWKDADRVVVRMRTYASGQSKIADFLARTDHLDELDARVDSMMASSVAFTNLRLRKRGDRLVGEASATAEALREALPGGLDVRPVASGGGQLLLEGSVGFLGATITARARLLAREGRLVVQPDVPLGGLLSFSVFDDKRVAVEAVGARVSPGGYTFTARAHLT
jgi:hypothetical protein